VEAFERWESYAEEEARLAGEAAQRARLGGFHVREEPPQEYRVDADRRSVESSFLLLDARRAAIATAAAAALAAAQAAEAAQEAPPSSDDEDVSADLAALLQLGEPKTAAAVDPTLTDEPHDSPDDAPDKGPAKPWDLGARVHCGQVATLMAVDATDLSVRLRFGDRYCTQCTHSAQPTGSFGTAFACRSNRRPPRSLAG
jgi:hypothetical protein